MNIDFESMPVYGDDEKYIKTKMKIHADSIIVNFHNKRMPKEKAPCKCLSIIMKDSVIKVNKNIIHKHFQKIANAKKQKIKIENYINEKLDKSESESDSNNETESDIDNEE